MESGTHIAIAQIAVTFAGFSALVSALGHHEDTADPRVDGFRLQLLVETSLFVAAFALLPLLPAAFGIDGALTIRLSSGVYLPAAIAYSAYTLVRSARIQLFYTLADRLTVYLNWSFVAIGILAMLWVAIGTHPWAAEGLYVSELFLDLLVAGVLFLRVADSLFTRRV